MRQNLQIIVVYIPVVVAYTDFESGHFANVKGYQKWCRTWIVKITYQGISAYRVPRRCIYHLKRTCSTCISDCEIWETKR